jgi:hypothetical protein
MALVPCQSGAAVEARVREEKGEKRTPERERDPLDSTGRKELISDVGSVSVGAGAGGRRF